VRTAALEKFKRQEDKKTTKLIAAAIDSKQEGSLYTAMANTFVVSKIKLVIIQIELVSRGGLPIAESSIQLHQASRRW